MLVKGPGQIVVAGNVRLPGGKNGGFVPGKKVGKS